MSQLRQHARYQRRLMDSGVIPPAKATRPRKCRCGVTFNPGNCGVRRWDFGDEVMWISTCPECRSTITTHRSER